MAHIEQSLDAVDTGDVSLVVNEVCIVLDSRSDSLKVVALLTGGLESLGRGKAAVGEEGSEAREYYAGLIEKIENYNTIVRKNYTKTIKSIGENSVKFGAVAKYGFQILPICQSYDVVSDQFVSVNHSSFGATTPTVYETLSDEYIAMREAEGKGKYISPDKMIDASTCIYPDYTWFIKGSSHSNWTTYERKIMYDVASADRQLTHDDFPYTQFMVYDTPSETLYPMTEENCHTEFWDADPDIYKPVSYFDRLKVAIKAISVWFPLFIEQITKNM